MHSPDLCNKVVKVTADDREIEVVEKGKDGFVCIMLLFNFKFVYRIMTLTV